MQKSHSMIYCHNKPSCTVISIHMNTVTTLAHVPNITNCPASSSSPPICCAIVKDDTAVGEANKDNIIASSAPRKLNTYAAKPRHIAGISIRREISPITRYFKLLPTVLKCIEAPNMIRASGVVIDDMLPIAFSITVGKLMLQKHIIRPKTELIIRGLVTMPFNILKIFGFLLLNTSRVITAAKLNIGTIIAISTDALPIAAPAHKASVTGRPKITKFERNIACISTPRLVFSFTVIGIITNNIPIQIITADTAKTISFGLKACENSLSYIFLNIITGRNTLKITLFICLTVVSFIILNFFNEKPSTIIRKIGNTTLNDIKKFCIPQLPDADISHSPSHIYRQIYSILFRLYLFL